MPTFVKTHRHGDVLVVEIDNPPVNALGAGVPEALRARRSTRRSTTSGVAAIVVRGAGRTFVAGADITTLEDAAWGRRAPRRPTCTSCCHAIEDCRKPVVMAIHGTALGGGLELAMAGHYRVAVAGAQVGQPEVNLGIIPGAEGTQRLPRLVGVEKALDMCVTGKPMPAAEALAAGILDEIADERSRRRRRSAFARRVAARDGRIRRRASARDRLGTPATNAPLFAAARATAREGQAAPDGAAEGRRRDRSRRHAAVRRRVPPRARALLRVRARRAGQGADPRVLRRARGVEAARGASRVAAAPSPHASPSSAPARWAAASRWRARTPASTSLLTDAADAAPRRRHGSDPDELRRLRDARAPHRGRRRPDGWRASIRSRRPGSIARRRGGSRYRGRVRGPGAEAAGLPRARSRREAGLRPRDQHVDARHRRDRVGDLAARPPSSACTSSARPT